MASMGLDYDYANGSCFNSATLPPAKASTRTPEGQAIHPPIGTRRAFPNPNMHLSLDELESDYPAYPPEAVEVRNTFIHVASPGPEEDGPSRPVLSCPASHIGWLHDIFEEDVPLPPKKKETPPSAPRRPVICLEDALLNATPLEPPFASAPMRLDVGRWGSHHQVPSMPREVRDLPELSMLPPGPSIPVLPAPLEPAPGSPELPSIGSKGHHQGDCRPCGFLYAKGCINGAMCTFCHLCDRGAKKRRQKAKKAALKGGA